MAIASKKKTEVGRRQYRKGRDVGRLVVATLRDSDIKSMRRLMVIHGHQARAGILRLALRRLAEAWQTDELGHLVVSVRRESCYGTEENKLFASDRTPVPVNLEAEDNVLLEDLKDRHELDSFAAVARLAIRYLASQE